MFTTAERLARAVLRNSPYARCFECLAVQVGLLQAAARDAAQVMIHRDDFGIARRVCQMCGRTDDVLVTGKVLRT
jgi:hypothetical protein